MGKRAARAKKPAVKDSAAKEAPAAKSPGRARKDKRPVLTNPIWMGVAAVAVILLAGFMMVGGGSSPERAEAAAITPEPAAPPANAAPAKPVRAIAGVPKKTAAAKPKSSDSSAVNAPKTASELPDPVRIEGCLEQAGATFRLKDTTGQDAPKARSWKSGFLKKGARPVQVVDWNNRLKDHVGERISVSGMLVDGEMRINTLRRVASSCN